MEGKNNIIGWGVEKEARGKAESRGKRHWKGIGMGMVKTAGCIRCLVKLLTTLLHSDRGRKKIGKKGRENGGKTNNGENREREERREERRKELESITTRTEEISTWSEVVILR